MQFLNLVETIASNLTDGNVSQFITLVENLIQLGETIVQHQQSSTQNSNQSAGS